MKPAAFEYHRPSTAAEAAALLAELGDDAKVLAGGQSLIPMLALRLAFFDHLVDIGRIDELKGIERRNGDLWIGAGTTDAIVGASAEVASAVPLRGPSDAVHRSLPDPQPRHARRFDRPRRSGRRVPGRRARRSTPRWRSSARRGGETSPPRLLRRPVEHGDRDPTSCSSGCRSRSGAAGAASPWRSSPAATATSPSPARRSASARRRRPHRAVRDRPDRSGLDPRAGHGRRGRADRASHRRGRARGGRATGGGGARLGSGRSARIGGLPHASGRGDGGESVGQGQPGGDRWVTCR